MRAEPATAAEATAATGPQPKGPRWLLPAGALLLAAVLAAWLADLVTHLSYMAAMRDLVVYRDGGLIVRHVSPAYDPHHASPLYDWTGQNGVQFTYPPFAAVIFAVASVPSGIREVEEIPETTVPADTVPVETVRGDTVRDETVRDETRPVHTRLLPRRKTEDTTQTVG